MIPRNDVMHFRETIRIEGRMREEERMGYNILCRKNSVVEAVEILYETFI